MSMRRFDARIRVADVFPPIPVRRFDFCATIDQLGEDGSPQGHGSTREAAIADLMSEICMNQGADTDGIGCAYCSAEAGVSCRASVIEEGSAS